MEQLRSEGNQVGHFQCQFGTNQFQKSLMYYFISFINQIGNPCYLSACCAALILNSKTK